MTTPNFICGYQEHFLLSPHSFEPRKNIPVLMNINIWNIYFELRVKDQIEARSSQLVRNLSSYEKKAWKKFRSSLNFFQAFFP